MECKSGATAEDIYEFKSAKESDSVSEKNATPESAETETDATESLNVPTTTSSGTTNDESSNKRSHGDVEGNEDSEKEEENKKKKKKEDGGNAKETTVTKTTQRGQNKSQMNKQATSGAQRHTSSSSSKTSGSTVEKKSPENSPKPTTATTTTTSNNASSDAEDASSNSGDGKSDLKVPPLKIVIPQSSTNEQETGTSRNGKNNSQRTHQALPYVVASSNSNDSSDKETTTGANSPENAGNAKEVDKKETDKPEEPATSTTEPEVPPATNPTVTPTPPTPVPVELHPRKRKMKQNREQTSAQVQQQAAETTETSTESREVHPHDQPITNCYKLFMNIRQQIEKRRKGLFLVQPKPPQGFKDYLMNRCTYVLANTAPTTPNINYPPTLPAQLKDLFADQEKQRYRLRMQHVIEKEKLVLSVEQEILRVHGRAARALANQSLPYSVCSILRDEEVYNLITPEQEEKDRNARSRHNGRLFLSWLQDVDDKWEKIKEHMLLRHHHEAESLHAVQKMNWEWKLKELSLCDRKSTPDIDELHVPEVHVSDDFDLLPA
ncbi:hypothetical protein ABEB36_001673 [Hypothenemus hampei]